MPSSEATFRNYTAQDGAQYAKGRFDYHPTLYDLVLTHHFSTKGQSGLVLDVGCGPGNAARALAGSFDDAIGLDPSAGMIAAATDLGGTARSGRGVQYVVSGAEELQGVQDRSVDLLVAATAAHWFDLTRFWARAAQVMAPNGTVALWTHRGLQIHPGTLNAAAIRAALEQIRADQLAPYEKEGGSLAGRLYVDLPLPWDAAVGVTDFVESSLRRVEFGTDSDGALPGDQFFADGEPEMDLDAYEANLGTTSTIKRWREANPDRVGTEEDVVRIMRRQIGALLREAGQEKGKERIKRADPGALLLLKKRA